MISLCLVGISLASIVIFFASLEYCAKKEDEETDKKYHPINIFKGK